LTSNSWAAFSSGLDKQLTKFENDTEVAKITLPNAALCLTANENHIFVLTFSSDVLIIDARDLSIKSNKKLVGFEATSMDICGNSIWVGDKKGNLHIFDANLTEIKKIEGKHSKAVTIVASNGKLVASGDAYRYNFVWDGETYEEVFNSGDLKDKILDLYLTKTHMVATTLDMAFGVLNLDEKSFLRT
jgi:hypothetical protein